MKTGKPQQRSKGLTVLHSGNISTGTAVADPSLSSEEENHKYQGLIDQIGAIVDNTDIDNSDLLIEALGFHLECQLAGFYPEGEVQDKVVHTFRHVIQAFFDVATCEEI
jgi:hypothetical protein